MDQSGKEQENSNSGRCSEPQSATRSRQAGVASTATTSWAMSLVSFFLKPVAYLSLPIFVLHSLSKQSPMIRYYVRVALYLSTLGLASAWGVIVSIGMTLIGRRFDINYIVARSFHFLAGNAMGIKFQLEGEEHLDSVRPAILVGNHQSMLDILYLGRSVQVERTVPKNAPVTL